jgi:hypothetical protein
MRLKLGLSAELTNKFQDELAKQLGDTIWAANIKDEGERYVFTFRMQGSDWHMELDKNQHAAAWYTLHCSTRQLHLPIDFIKDLKIFCKQIVRIKQMQSDFTDNKNK